MPSKKVSVTLSYANKGTQPPIFLAGSFSEPPWHPQEMDSTTDADGEHHFYKEIDVDEGGEFQYKFRIGLGDWWALNEQAPTGTDALGNTNNILLVPGAEEITKSSKSSESSVASAGQMAPPPESTIEKVDDEARHGDGSGLEAATGQENARQMRAPDVEPDQLVDRSQTNTSLYANTAAEVADSAAIIDRESSPAPVPDVEAGRTGERRMSITPIPQVAQTAAEVADTAAMLDQVEDSDDDSSRLAPLFPHETYSSETAPWHEQAPLFAHECLGPDNEVEIQSPVTFDSFRSPIKADAAGEVIDLNDPLLEPFPEDRLSILTHIRSCESRMSEDETNVHGVPPSPVTRAKSRSPSMDTPIPTRLDAQPSPGLDAIVEEHHDDGYFDDDLSPTNQMQGNGGVRMPDELNVIHEAEEPVEEPKNVLENLRKIEESIPDSENASARRTSVPGQISQSLVHTSDTSRVLQENVLNQPESTHDSRISSGPESESYDSSVPKVKKEPKGDFKMQEEVNDEQGDVEWDHHIRQDDNPLHAQKRNGIQNDIVVAKTSILQHSEPVLPQESVFPKVPQPVDSTRHDPEDENPDEGFKSIRNPIGDDLLKDQETYMDSLKAKQCLEEESQEISGSPELKQSGIEYINDIPKGRVLVEDVPAEGRIEVQDVVQASNIQEITAEHALDASPPNLGIPSENIYREAENPAKSILPVSSMEIEHDDIQVSQQNAPASDIQKSVIEAKDTQLESEESTEADLPNLPRGGDEAPLNQDINILASKIQVPVTSERVVSTEANRTAQGIELPASKMHVDEQGSQKLAEPVLQSDVNKSPVIESRRGEIGAGNEEIQSVSTSEVDVEISATHVKSAESDVGDAGGLLTDDVDTGRSTCDGHLSLEEDDQNLKLDPLHTTTPKVERPLTPSSIRSPLKVPESESFFKSIWRTLFVDWIGGIFATLCGGDRGPLVAISIVIIIGPVLAMYFFRVDEL